MKKVTWSDTNGFMHVSMLRDTDNIRDARKGIPSDPPNLKNVLSDIERELHNALVERDLLCYNDVIASQNGITAAILYVMRNKLIMAYREREINNNG